MKYIGPDEKDTNVIRSLTDNDTYEPIRVTPDNHFRIWGVMIYNIQPIRDKRKRKRMALIHSGRGKTGVACYPGLFSGYGRNSVQKAILFYRLFLSQDEGRIFNESI
ncbi:MAG: hypothetical protein LIP05_16340 [Tannerellaceae bacterium]|nr:hypothetical protein [Tannerellaceae bacterium]